MYGLRNSTSFLKNSDRFIIMPKYKLSKKEFLNSIVKNYSPDFSTDQLILYCKICLCLKCTFLNCFVKRILFKVCEAPYNFNKKFQVDQHVKSDKHVSRKRIGSTQQQNLLINSLTSTPQLQLPFFNDLCYAFISGT